MTDDDVLSTKICQIKFDNENLLPRDNFKAHYNIHNE